MLDLQQWEIRCLSSYLKFNNLASVCDKDSIEIKQLQLENPYVHKTFGFLSQNFCTTMTKARGKADEKKVKRG